MDSRGVWIETQEDMEANTLKIREELSLKGVEWAEQP